ncbi:Fc.00g007650.m01.CDS01 [Cosmosporella sp. VM-42]
MRLIPSIILGLIPLALALDITLYLPSKPNPFTLPPTTHATLTTLNGRLSAPLSSVNTFVFHNVTAESYLVDVHCATDGFQPLRVDVGADGSMEAWETYRGNEWGNRGEKLEVREGSAGRGVEIRALGGKNYFVERPKFSVLTILKNPMILMGMVSMALFIGMPYLMDNMDPELRAEFEAQQKSSPMNAVMGGAQQGQNPLGNFDMAAFLAGSGKKESGSGGAAKGQGQGQGVRR